MNWSSGLIRVWIVFALLWTCVGYFAADFGYWNTKVATAEANKNFVDSQYAKLVKEIDAQEQITFQEFAKQFREEYLPSFQATKELNYSQAQLRQLQIVVFAPPTVLLIIGLTLGWIFRGFTGNARKKLGDVE